MSVDIWLLYVATILLFMSSPGPSHILMISASMGNGFKKSLATAAGDLTANAIQIVLAGFGLAAVITSSRYGFAMVKWMGVAYLVWLGVKTLIASFKQRSNTQQQTSISTWNLWLRGFITSAANPKAVVFFAALFPQFIEASSPLVPQVFILGVTYIVIDGLFLATYGLSASWLAKQLRLKTFSLIDRISGISLILTAIMLGLRKSEN